MWTTSARTNRNLARCRNRRTASLRRQNQGLQIYQWQASRTPPLQCTVRVRPHALGHFLAPSENLKDPQLSTPQQDHVRRLRLEAALLCRDKGPKRGRHRPASRTRHVDGHADGLCGRSCGRACGGRAEGACDAPCSSLLLILPQDLHAECQCRAPCIYVYRDHAQEAPDKV